MTTLPSQRKVVHVIDSLGTGGAETLVVDLALQAIGHGWEVQIVTLWETQGLPLKRARQAGLSIVNLMSSKTPGPGALITLWRICRNASVIHVHLFPASYLVAVLPRIGKTIYTEHSSTNRRRRSPTLRFFERLVLKRYTRVVCVSNASAESLRRSVKLPDKVTVQVINNGIRAEFFGRRATSRKRLDDVRVLCVGRLIPSKNLEIVLRLAVSRQNIHLTIVGDGPERQALERFSEQAQISQRCSFMPSTERLPEIFGAADIFVGSSNSEGFGLVALEAMASGLPVVLSDIPAHRTFADHRVNSILFQPDNLRSLQNAFDSLSESQPLRQTLSRAGQITARQFTVESAATAYTNLYDEILCSHPRPTGDIG